MSKSMKGRDFIKMMRPILGIDQKRIVSMTITANCDAPVIVSIDCLGANGASADATEVTASETATQSRRFIIDVEEVRN